MLLRGDHESVCELTFLNDSKDSDEEPEVTAGPAPKRVLSEEQCVQLIHHVQSTGRQAAGLAFLLSCAKNGFTLNHPKKFADHGIDLKALRSACVTAGAELVE